MSGCLNICMLILSRNCTSLPSTPLSEGSDKSQSLLSLPSEASDNPKALSQGALHASNKKQLTPKGTPTYKQNLVALPV